MFIKRSHVAATHDIVMAFISIIISLYLRVGDNIPQYSEIILPSAIIFTAVCAVVFSFAGLYKGVWRYASITDLANITKAVAIASLIFIPAMFMYNRMESFPRSVLVINFLVLLAMLGGPRILYRMIKDQNFSLNFLGSSRSPGAIEVLLVGVNDNAVGFLRETARNKNSEYEVVAIADNNVGNIGREIHGVQVYGDVASIPKIIKRLKREGRAPRRIILAQDYLDNKTVGKLLKVADNLGFTLAKLPRISDFKDSVDKLEIKPIAIEDLLGRAQNTPMLGRREELINGKNILVTGAGGTIGSELVRQIASYNPANIILAEISEFNLYKIDKELEENFSQINRKSLICDIRNRQSLDNIFAQHKPEIVFHAAALKHVPIVEENLAEAVMTNIIGTKNVADMCIKHNIDRMVAISTDKAVNPTSLMGVTKRIAECYVQTVLDKNDSNVKFSTVRFGNVLGSSGSVIPLFQKQLERGGPITVTHPDMVRYFMTVPEAVELVLQASTLQNSKESSIFVLDMGQPININDLALQMIKLAGLKPDEDIKIEYTGVRPGEKLYEELFYDNEEKLDTLYEGILLAKAKHVEFDKLEKTIENLSDLCIKGAKQEIINNLVSIVPEYDSNPKITPIRKIA